MQIYRLLAARRFRLGTIKCYRWAKGARARTGADIPPADRAAKYQQLLNLKFPPGARRVRHPVGLPRLNSRLLGVREKEFRHERAEQEALHPEIAKRKKRLTKRLIYRLSKRPLSTLQLAAERLGDPLGPNDDSFNPGDWGRATTAERLAKMGAARIEGVQRWSRKRVSFDKIQLKANELAANRGGRVSYRELAGVVGVSVSTLRRWLTVGHLKAWGPELNLSGYGATVQRLDNIHKLDVDETSIVH